MKKIYYILTLVAAAMTISACNNAFEDEGPALNGGEGSDNTITFVVGPETDAVGRTALDLEDGKTTLWKATDNAGLYYSYTLAGTSTTVAVDDVQNVKLKINGEASANAVFVGNDSPVEWWKGEGYEDATHKFYFYYPYKEGTASQSKVEGTLPAEQTYDATASEWDMSKYDFVYATKAEAYGKDVELQIKRAFSVLRLGITNNSGEDVTIEEVSLTSEGGKILAGTFYVNTTKGEMDNALSNRTDAPTKATHGSNTAYGYWTSTNSTITTIVTNGAVKAGEKIDVRFMLNAGYSKSDVSADKFIDTTTPYLEGDTFTVRIKTNKGTHPAVQFTAGALLRGQRAGKSITLDAAPTGGPTILSVESSDSNKDNFYLNSNIIIKGSNLLNVADVKVGGIATEIVSQGNTELVVKMVDCTGAATEAASYAITYGADKALGNITVYPFYHYEDIVLGIGSNSSGTYSDFSSANAYFVPDDGEVYSAKDFAATNKDYGIGLGAGVVNPYVTAKKTYAATMTSELYAAVKPYVVFVTDSSGKLTIVNPTNTDMALKNHRYKGEGSSSYNIYVGETFGTPFMQYRVMKSSSELVYANSVIEGTLTNLDYAGSAATSDAPVFTSADFEGNSLWADGRVILMQYKDTDKSTVIKNGFIHITKVDVTKAGMSTDGKGYQLITVNPETGKRDGKVTFDMYWSK